MSTRDTLTPLISSPWCDADGRPLSVRALPGLRPETLKMLEKAYPGIMSPALKDLLSTCCGLVDTELGHLDFTGCSFPEEPCSVFKPCVTIAVDDSGRRWIAELGGPDLPGPVWCVFPNPEVAVWVSDDLAAFLSTLRDNACRAQTLAWLQDLTATARTVWWHRRSLALRPHNVSHADRQIRGWLSSLPPDAYVYDLRTQSRAKGWPYGVAGPSSRLYRCGRLAVFAVAGSPTEGWRLAHPQATSPLDPVTHVAAENTGATRLRDRRRFRSQPVNPMRRPRINQALIRSLPATNRGANGARPEVRRWG
jgi:hypothetical protein